MYNADDQTLMAALRAADPLDPEALGTDVQRRLEADWRAARALADATPPSSGTPSPAWSGPSTRRVVAAAITAVVLASAGVVLARVIARPTAVVDQPEPPPGDGSTVADEELDALLAAPAEPEAVTGSYRLIIDRNGSRDVIDVAGGTVRYHFGEAWRYAPPTAWNGFAPTEPVYMLERITAGRRVFARLEVEPDGAAAWYRRPVEPRADLDRALAVTSSPRLPDGGAGFAQVEDVDERGWTQWASSVSDADLDFLGPLVGSLTLEEPPADARVVLTLDRNRRVTSVEIDGESAGPRLWFGMFDRLAPARLPSGDVPVATARNGMYVDVCGAETAADRLRAEISQVIDRASGVAGFAFVGPTFAEPVDVGQANEPSYGVAITFARTADPEGTYVSLSRTLDRLVDAEATVCRSGTVNWVELDPPRG